MNLKFWESEESIYDEPIEKVLEELRQHDPDSEEFAKSMGYLERLTKLKDHKRPSLGVSPDTWIIAGANILAIVIIAVVDHDQPMTSKAMNYFKPLKNGQ